ncbi:hypothetical protein PH563_16200 [Rhizobium phaseoli]|nr:hypothetical protein [Rhizobium phaseoli]MDK4727448.1 hypothetical protein [Rhizobium phaseoli]
MERRKLKKSFASRHAFIVKPEPYNVAVQAWPAPWKTSDEYLNLSFNIGRNVNDEIIHLRIHKSDYAEIMKTMMETDREETLKAFARAVLASSPDA